MSIIAIRRSAMANIVSEIKRLNRAISQKKKELEALEEELRPLLRKCPHPPEYSEPGNFGDDDCNLCGARG